MNSKLPTVCVVDDERSIGRALLRLFRRLDVSVEAFVDPREALAWLKQHPVAILITDQRMPGMSGTELVAALDGFQDQATKFILSGYSDFEEITAAFNSGQIQKYISKPWDDEELLYAVERVLALKETPGGGSDALGEQPVLPNSPMLGASPKMVKLFEQIRRMSTANVPVFIYGETGTGKELVARALHQESFRASRPFVPVNCANFSSELMESQLFGHKKGAFTGADKDRTGLLATANGGTVFLDEVTTLPLELQAKLLRVLQEREYTPLGSNDLIPFDAQILSASSKRLSAAVEDGEFRQDLRYRLEVLPLDIPPLRERDSDAVILFRHYLREVRQDTNFDFSRDFEHFLQDYQWPGNVRQLINLAGYVATMADSEELTLDSLPAETRESYLRGEGQTGLPPSASATSIESVAAPGDEAIVPLKDVERQAIERALRLCDDNIPRAAAMLGVSASTIYRKIQSWNDE
ncbi:MAG: sigma-54 dependent transcriptional regulator [Halieaceae bacterium]|jgi:DNA-binding NtrC family response regulator|nr:sigma-54 dependent transcriptional regulator [Halieaceae bacterium]